MPATKVKDLMTAHPELISPDATLRDAAQAMKRIDCGILPVGTENKLEGIITDRDIVIRAVSRGGDISREKVSTYMSKDVHTCSENDLLRQAADQMHKHDVNRLIVKDSNGKVSGILSFGAILRKDANATEVSEVVQHAVGRKAA